MYISACGTQLLVLSILYTQEQGILEWEFMSFYGSTFESEKKKKISMLQSSHTTYAKKDQRNLKHLLSYIT